MKATAILATTLSILVPLASGLGKTDTITWGGDNSRSGYQTNHNMDPAIVGSSDFAQIFKTALPGKYNGANENIFSQPLVYTPSGGTTQYVYFATTQNNVYKLDAKTGQILLSRNLAIPFLTADLNGCVDINPLIGVTSTGVIDPDTDTLYLTSKTYENQTGGNGPQGKPNGRYYLHALNVNDLTDRPNFPVNLEGIVARNNPTRSFNGGIQHQRPGLLHTGQFIYAGFASHCVQYNFTGWIMGFDKTTGAVVERYATEGAGVPNTTPGGGVWMSGGGLASDDQGSLYFGTGNGYASQLSTIPVAGRNPPTSLEEAAVHMTINEDGSVTVVDFFMPQEKQALDGADKDLGTSPLELLPSQFSCGSIKHMGVITGKNGKTYFLNLDDLGGYRTGDNSGDRVVQIYQNENAVYSGAGVYPLEGGYIYVNVIQYRTHVFKFSCVNGVPSFIKVGDSPTASAYTLGVSHATITSLDGEEGTGLLWNTDIQGSNIRIFKAVPENGLLTEIRNFTVPGVTKFTRAVFGDGRMYMGSNQGYVYGFGAPTTPALNCTTPVNLGSLDIASSAVTAQVTCTAAVATTIKSLAITDPNFNVSSTTTFPATLAKGSTFTFTASFKPTAVGLLTGSVSIATTNGVAGYASTTSVLLQGTGLSAGALFSVSPSVLTFTNVVIGATPGGVVEPVIFSNTGNSTLTISDIMFSDSSSSGPWVAGTATINGTSIGAFTLSGLPTTIAANGGQNVAVNFNPTTGGNSTLFVKVVTNGGNQTFEIDANAGPGSTCLLEFQTPDGSGWVTYEKGMNFTFGNVTENTSRSLLLRVTNNGTSDAVPLSITVSKPPFGIGGIIGAANQVDLAEGTILKPGESASAALYCSVPKEQWNNDAYWGTAQWTMNTNDPNWDKQFIQFSCLAVSEQAPPLKDNGDGVYRYAGCYKENNPGRQLQKQLYSNANNTAATCIAACVSGGFTYCGTQYHSECWGGNTVPVQLVDEGNCNFACSGDLNQICGGNGVGANAGGSYISLFSTDGASTNSSTNPPGGPVVNPGNYGYVSVGCYHEPSSGRALSSQVSVSSQTVNNCLAAAALGSYKFAGVEYGGECWVGNTLNSGASQVTLSTCASTCNGNGSEFCGGSLLLNVYQLNGTATLPSSTPGSGTGTTSPTATPTGGPFINPGSSGFSYVGCWHEPSSGRAFSKQLTVTSQTVNNCLAAAASGNYQYAGLEYGGECWVGNTINSAASQVAGSACTMTCNGNKTELCGGSLLMDLYQFNVTVAATSSSKTVSTTKSVSAVSHASTASVSSSKSATPTPSGPPAVKAAVGNWVYQGCYTEANGSRALSAATWASAGMSYEACAAFCASYAYFGVEFGDECYCDNYLAATSGAADEQDCTVVCAGDASEVCGGGDRLNVYKQTGKQTGAPNPAAQAGDYVYVGCYTEATSGRALDALSFSTDNMTADACAAFCGSSPAYTYFGVEYGTQCYCGNDPLGDGATSTNETECNMACGGNAYQACGGSSRLNLYKYSPQPSASAAVEAERVSASSSSSASAAPSSSSVDPSSSIDPSASSAVSSSADPTSSSANSSSSSTEPHRPSGIGQSRPSVSPVSVSASASSVSASASSDPVASPSSSISVDSASSASSASASSDPSASSYASASASSDPTSSSSVDPVSAPSSDPVAASSSASAASSSASSILSAASSDPVASPSSSADSAASYVPLSSMSDPVSLVSSVDSVGPAATSASVSSAAGSFDPAASSVAQSSAQPSSSIAQSSGVQSSAAQSSAAQSSLVQSSAAQSSSAQYSAAQSSADPAASSVAASSDPVDPPSASPSSPVVESSPVASSAASSSASSADPSTVPSDPAPSSSAEPVASSVYPSAVSSPAQASTSSQESLISQASLDPASTRPVVSSPVASDPAPSSSESNAEGAGAGATSVAQSSPAPSTVAAQSSSVVYASPSSDPVVGGATSAVSSDKATSVSVTIVSDPEFTPSPSASASPSDGDGLVDAASATVSSSTTVSDPTSSSPPTGQPTSGPACYQPVAARGNANFTLLNCYQEPSNKHHLLSDFIVQDRTGMSVGLCLSKCWKYQYAGLENGDQCWCSNHLDTGNGGVVVDLSSCNKACSGNKTEYCGARDKVLVYNLMRTD